MTTALKPHPSHDLTDISDASLVADFYCPNCGLSDCADEEERLAQPCTGIGYHRAQIKKGVLGESSKIQEELDELKDAEEQGVAIMALVELSDLIGSVEAYLEKNHPSVSLDDLRAMSEVTRRAFKNGRRS